MRVEENNGTCGVSAAVAPPSISGRGVDIQLGGKKGSIPEEQLNKEKEKIKKQKILQEEKEFKLKQQELKDEERIEKLRAKDLKLFLRKEQALLRKEHAERQKKV